MEEITSRENKTIKHISKLISSSKYRKECGQFVIEGIRLCNDAAQNAAEIVCLVCSKTALEKYTEVINKLSQISEKSICITDHIFSSLCDTKTPQGVLCVVKALDKSDCFDTIKGNTKILALENIQDPGNLGTMFRSADALGIDAVVLSQDCCDVYSPKVVRGSMGAVFRIPFVTVALCDFINDFNIIGRSFAAVLDRESISVKDCDFSGSVLAAVGNEGNGLSDKVIECCSQKLYIPMYSNAESLNAAVASSIIMWEMTNDKHH